MNTDLITVFVTCGTTDEARHIGKMLVHERLAACANILGGGISIYQWQGRVMEESEIVLLLKTRRALMDDVNMRIRALHSYDTPCIVAWPIVGGDAEYCEWVSAQTTKKTEVT